MLWQIVSVYRCPPLLTIAFSALVVRTDTYIPSVEGGECSVPNYLKIES